MNRILRTLILFALLSWTHAGLADFRWLSGTDSQLIDDILRDNSRDLIYVSDSGNQRLLRVDTNLETFTEISLPAPPGELAISKDGQVLAVSLGASGIALVDLNAGTLDRVLPVTDEVSSLAFDHSGRLFYSIASGTWGNIVHYDPATETVIDSFGLGPNLTLWAYRKALLRTNAAGTILFVGERGLSPASLTKIDVSGPAPIFLGEDAHGDLGSNLQEFSISEQRNLVYLTSGAPYGVQVIDGSTVARLDLLAMDPYPNGVELTVGENYIFGLRQTTYADDVYLFDGTTEQLLQSFDLLDNPNVFNSRLASRGIAVSRDGAKLFAVTGDTGAWRIQVMDTGVSDPGNTPPVISTPQSSYTVKRRRTLSFTVSAGDIDGDPLTLSASGLPNGATFTPAADHRSGEFRWDTRARDVGDYTVTFEVTDGQESVSVEVAISVVKK